MMLDELQGFYKMENDPTADRNREPADPDNNMNVDENNDGEELMEGGNEAPDEDELDDEEFGPQEFSALNNQLDQLQSALDSLETRNDDIHSKLLDLLKSSKEIRQVMAEENNQNQSMEEGDDSDEGNAGDSTQNQVVVEKNCTSSTETPSSSTVQNHDDQNIPE